MMIVHSLVSLPKDIDIVSSENASQKNILSTNVSRHWGMCVCVCVSCFFKSTIQRCRMTHSFLSLSPFLVAIICSDFPFDKVAMRPLIICHGH